MFDKFKSNEIIHALSNKTYFPLYSSFLITMVMEELIFRFYSIGLLLIFINEFVAILISSFIFSLYHIHIWYTFRNKRLLIIYLFFSFLLGLLNGFLLIQFGIIFCIIIHYGLTFIFYWSIYKKYKSL
ncbi:MAG: CPBP family intramembrane metalloprotease [Candidatus Lokiarchaeota archaeon]|nr:CPBP family intramembrane metalloprotease [Candidatus Lokiarchaeota archaeon]